MAVGKRSSERVLQKALGQFIDELRPISLGARNIFTNGTEQTLVEQPGGAVSQISGYVNLGKLATADTVIMRLYVKVKPSGEWCIYHEESYSGVQTLPLVHITKKPENHGLKITLQQTIGAYKAIEYEFFREY